MVKDNNSRGTCELLDVFNNFWIIFLLDFCIVLECLVLCWSIVECEPILVQGECVFSSAHVLDLDFVLLKVIVSLELSGGRVSFGPRDGL